MAKTTTVTTTDDIDGTRAVEEISFAFRGTSYTIDLSKKNAAAFDKALKPYLSAASRVPASRRTATGRKGRPSPARSGSDVAAIRTWAAENGHAVNSPGRIPTEIREAYEAAK